MSKMGPNYKTKKHELKFEKVMITMSEKSSGDFEKMQMIKLLFFSF